MTTQDSKAQEQAKAVLTFGRLLEPFGLPPIAGRLYGCLLLEGRELSLDELVTGTASSKASVSQNARIMEREGWIERAPRLSDRKDYYALGPRGGTQPVELLLQQLRAFGVAYRGVCDAGHARNAQSRNHLRLCASLFDHMASSVEGQLTEWRSRVGS